MIPRHFQPSITHVWKIKFCSVNSILVMELFIKNTYKRGNFHFRHIVHSVKYVCFDPRNKPTTRDQRVQGHPYNITVDNENFATVFIR